MPGKATKTPKQRTTPEKWSTIAREEVLNHKTFLDAMLAANYSESYARSHGQLIKRDDRYCKIKEQIKAKLVQQTRWKVQDIQDNAREVYLSCKDGTTNDSKLNINLLMPALKANEQYGKTLGAFIDKQVSLNVDLPPDDPDEQTKWIESHTQLAGMLDDVPDAVARE